MKPGDDANTTRYGVEGEPASTRIVYIHPNYEKASMQQFKGGTINILTRKATPDGKICLKNKDFWGDEEKCRTVWKKGSQFMNVSPLGYKLWVYTKKKGTQKISSEKLVGGVLIYISNRILSPDESKAALLRTALVLNPPIPEFEDWCVPSFRGRENWGPFRGKWTN